MTTPTQRTIAMLKEQGITHVGIVERYIKSGGFGHRSDLFGIIDLIALLPFGQSARWKHGIIGIQVFGKTGWPSHVKTVMVEQAINTRAWLIAGGALELHGWRQLKKKRGGKAMKWVPRIGDVTLKSGELTLTERGTNV